MHSTYIDALPERIEIKGNVVYYIRDDGPSYSQPICVAQQTAHMVLKAIEQWHREQRGEVVSLKKRRRRH